MPTSVRRVKRKDGKKWAIVEKSTGRIKGRSRTKRAAKISASIRDRASKKK